MTPSGTRVTAVMPLKTDNRTNLVQMSTLMSALSVDLEAGRPARLEQRLERGERRIRRARRRSDGPSPCGG